MHRPSRRALLAVSAAGALASRIALGQQEPSALEPLPRRALGRTGRELPLLGLGCYPLGSLPSEDDALAIVRRAWESGARYFDTAPSYSDGASERRVGKALKGCAREELFVATKTLERDGDAALAELERSLERLGMDYVDSVQVHEVRSDDDVDAALASDGVVKALAGARAKHKVRHIGITAHRDPAVLVEAVKRYDFATALVPVNPLDVKHRSFVRVFLPLARDKQIGVIAMKIFAGGALVGEDRRVSPGDLVRFALAQPGVTVAVPGSTSVAQWEESRYAAVQPAPDAAEEQRIIGAVGEHRGTSSEWYKRE